MKLLLLLLIGVHFLGNAQTIKKQDMITVMNDEAAIRELENNLAAAITAMDVDAIMKNYVPDNSFVIFDVVPRSAYRGADTYRSYWTEMFTHFKGQLKFSIADLSITVDGNVGFGSSFQNVKGTDKEGQPVDRTVMVTNGYRKIGGKWLIALEHISVPVDFRTGKLVPLKKP